jgi:hypothetical protein
MLCQPRLCSPCSARCEALHKSVSRTGIILDSGARSVYKLQGQTSSSDLHDNNDNDDVGSSNSGSHSVGHRVGHKVGQANAGAAVDTAPAPHIVGDGGGGVDADEYLLPRANPTAQQGARSLGWVGGWVLSGWGRVGMGYDCDYGARCCRSCPTDQFIHH